MRASSVADVEALSKIVEDDAYQDDVMRLGMREGGALVTFVNPLTVRMLRQRPDFLAELSAFDRVYSDGGLLCRALALIKRKPQPRCSFDGNSIAIQVFEHAKRDRLKLGIVATEQPVLERAVAVLEDAGIPVAYMRNGFFAGEAERAECWAEVAGAGIDVLIVGMGAPHQEQFLLGLRRSGWKGVGFTCGGYVEQIAQAADLRFYPAGMNFVGLRALYRIIRDPRRLGYRYLVEYMPFYGAYVRLLLARAK